MDGRIIVLEDLSGFDFEVVCKRVFEGLGYRDVRLGPRVSDVGRDIIMNSPTGETIIVECKHHLWQTIGRPVVQKLHSAVIFFSAAKGILVTTGYFSEEARDYAARLDGLVELVDLNRFKEIAEKAGFAVYERRRDAPKQVLFTYTSDQVVNIVEREIAMIVSRPHSPLELLKCSNKRLVYRPIYLIKYSVYSEVYTSTGRLIDVINARGTIVLDGRTGKLLGSSEKIFGSYQIAPLKSRESGEVLHPLINPVDSREIAVNELVEQHSKYVVYMRKGSSKLYTKFVSPRKSDIDILSITPLFVPELILEYSAQKHRYRVVCDLSAPQFRLYKLNELALCTICGKLIYLHNKRVLCNDCGGIAHFGFFTKHAFRCKSCGKTICRQCVVKRRRWLVFETSFCRECVHASSLSFSG
jgi:hypothetical protein